MSYRNLFMTLALAGAVLNLLPHPAAKAESPFFCYPAYGAQRGKIRNVNGVFRSKQTVHWGGGLTANGVAFFHDAFGAASTILPAVLKEAQPPDSSRAASGPTQNQIDEFRRSDQAAMDRALALRDKTVALAQRYGVTAADLAVVATPAGHGSTPAVPAANAAEIIKNWDNDPNFAPPASPVSPGPGAPAGPSAPGPGGSPILDG